MSNFRKTEVVDGNELVAEQNFRAAQILAENVSVRETSAPRGEDPHDITCRPANLRETHFVRKCWGVD